MPHKGPLPPVHSFFCFALQRFDMRPQYMSFEFNCRTSDNVEMILEGTFFWE